MVSFEQFAINRQYSEHMKDLRDNDYASWFALTLLAYKWYQRYAQG